MSRIAPLALLLITTVSSAVAQDQQLILRFGPTLLVPNGDSGPGPLQTELESQSGLGLGFEWMFHSRWGLDVGHDISLQAAVNRNGEEAAVTTFGTLVLGINGHPVRTERIDWGVGAFFGSAFLTDWESRNDHERYRSESTATWGAQTFLDITASRTWAVHIGARYYDVAFDLGPLERLDYDPLVFRLMAAVRW